HTSSPHSYTEVSPPILVRDQVMFGTAQLPKFEEDQFYALSSLLPKDVAKKVELVRDAIAKNVEKSTDLDNAVAELRVSLNELLSKSGVPDVQQKLLTFVEQQIIYLKTFYSERLRKTQLELIEAIAPLESRYWLIPTAEVPLTNLVRESIIDED